MDTTQKIFAKGRKGMCVRIMAYFSLDDFTFFLLLGLSIGNGSILEFKL